MMQLNKNIMLFIFMILPMCNVVASDSPQNELKKNIVTVQQQAEKVANQVQEVGKKVGADSKNMLNCYYNTFRFMKSPQEIESYAVLALKDIVRDKILKKNY